MVKQMKNKDCSTMLGWYNLIEHSMPLQKMPKGPIVTRVLIYSDHVEVEYAKPRKNGSIHYRLAKYDYLDILAMNDCLNRIMRVKQ